MEGKLKVLLLDDEPLILQSLLQMIDWDALGCVIAGTAVNGREGLELIAALTPDIVISDIVMPEADGLEIAAFCQRQKTSRVILISAYSDFSFAQEAMASGVKQYILKPIDSDKLREAVAETAREIRAEREQARSIASLTESAEGQKTLAASSLLFRIACYGQALTDEEAGLLSQMSAGEAGFMAAVRFYNAPADEAEYHERMREARRQIRECLGDERLLWGNANDQLLFLYRFGLREPGEEYRKEAAARLGDWIASRREAEGQTAVCVGLSDVSADYSYLHTAYQQCVRRARDGFFSSAGTVNLRDRSVGTRVYEADPLLLRHHMRNGNTEAMRAEAVRWREYVLHLPTEEDAMDATREMYRNIMASASKIGMTNRSYVSGRVLRNENADRLIGNLMGFMEEVARYARESQDTVSRIRTILEEHYTDSSFSLSELAERMNLNASYVSRLFKKEFDENFSAWLLGRRLRQARFLLDTTALRVREISAQVGFEDEHYFSMVFKRETGQTPSQYREEAEKRDRN